MYFGYPGAVNGSRTNYTLLRSTDEGASWNYYINIYPHGAGYSDMVILPSDGPNDLLGIAFQRTLWESGVEGGGYNMAWATVEAK